MPDTRSAPKGPVGAADNVVFAIIMALAAYLGRENPRFRYPEILWSFLTLLLFNLLHLSLPSRSADLARRARLSAAGNLAAVTLVAYCSGGSASYFWVMYLLPIFSACLAFKRSGIILICALVFLCLAGFYRDAFRVLIWPEIIEMLVKSATLFTAGAAISRVAFRERETRALLDSEQAKAHQETLRMREELQHMDRLATMGTLSAGIIHELRSPLASILGFAELARQPNTQAAEIDQALAKIEDGVRRCERTINDMLGFARRGSAGKAPADLNALIHKCVELKKYDWIDGRVEIEEDYNPALPKVALSGAQFQQVIFNLLTNAEHAVQAKAEGGGRIRIATKLQDGRVSVRVEDNGCGIARENLPKIWQPFFTTKPAGQGTGLGLPICKKIVEESGGTIAAESEIGRGTAFVIGFPGGATQEVSN